MWVRQCRPRHPCDHSPIDSNLCRMQRMLPGAMFESEHTYLRVNDVAAATKTPFVRKPQAFGTSPDPDAGPSSAASQAMSRLIRYRVRLFMLTRHARRWRFSRQHDMYVRERDGRDERDQPTSCIYRSKYDTKCCLYVRPGFGLLVRPDATAEIHIFSQPSTCPSSTSQFLDISPQPWPRHRRGSHMTTPKGPPPSTSRTPSAPHDGRVGTRGIVRMAKAPCSTAPDSLLSRAAYLGCRCRSMGVGAARGGQGPRTVGDRARIVFGVTVGSGEEE